MEKERSSLEFIREKYKEYNPKIALITSFGKDSMVITDLVRKVTPDIPVLWVKPPFLPEETIELAEKVEKLWDLNLKEIESDKVHDEQFMQDIVLKPNLPKNNPDLCCEIFKVEPMMRAVEEMDLDAWFSGLRSTESEKRGMYAPKWKQGRFVKLHPIVDWTEREVWEYIREHELPYHPWYDEGWRSIGCAPCSSPSKPGEDERAGRWRDTLKQGGGCGLHCIPMR